MSQKLSNKATSSKAYWSILKTFLNDKKILCIPPVFRDNKFVIDFREKAELFNTFFAEQCSLPKYNSELPKNLLFLTEICPSNVQISNENIIKIINNFKLNKAPSQDQGFIQAILMSVIRHKKLNFLIYKSLFVFVFAELLSYWNSFAAAFLAIKIKRYLNVSYKQLFDCFHINNITYITH